MGSICRFWRHGNSDSFISLFQTTVIKNLKILIKGLILTTVFAAAFLLNTAPEIGAYHGADTKICLEQNTDSALNSYFIPNAKAQAPQTASEPVKIPEGLRNFITTANSLINGVFNPIFNMLVRHIGDFLKNDLIYGGNMGLMLKKIWVISRNIVNILFVLALLYMALMYIFKGDESTDLKKQLPMFVIMLVAVNFSWLASKVILDAANVATNIVFAIPSGIQIDTKLSNECSKDNREYCMGYKVFNAEPATGINEVFPDSQENCSYFETRYNDYNEEKKKGIENKDSKYKDILHKQTVCYKKRDLSAINSSNAAFQLTYNMAQVQRLGMLATTSAKQLDNLGFASLFAFVIQFIFVITMSVLFIVLIARLIALWLMVSFSPILVLALFLEKTQIAGKVEALSNFDVNAFMKWAFAPVKVAAVWTVGFIMVSVGQMQSKDFFQSISDNATSLTGTNPIRIETSIFMSFDSIWEIIWLIMTVVIIWSGTFMMVKDLPAVGAITDKIKGFGEKYLDVAKLAAQSAPIIPMKAQDGTTVRVSAEKAFGGITPSGIAKRLGDTNAITYELQQLEKNIKQNPAKVETLKNSNTPQNAYTNFKAVYNLQNNIITEHRDKVIKTMMTDNKMTRDEASKVYDLIKQHIDNPAQVTKKISNSDSVNPPK